MSLIRCHKARATAQVCIFCSAGFASFRRLRLNSHVIRPEYTMIDWYLKCRNLIRALHSKSVDALRHAEDDEGPAAKTIATYMKSDFSPKAMWRPR